MDILCIFRLCKSHAAVDSCTGSWRTKKRSPGSRSASRARFTINSRFYCTRRPVSRHACKYLHERGLNVWFVGFFHEKRRFRDESWLCNLQVLQELLLECEDTRRKMLGPKGLENLKHVSNFFQIWSKIYLLRLLNSSTLYEIKLAIGRLACNLAI